MSCQPRSLDVNPKVRSVAFPFDSQTNRRLTLRAGCDACRARKVRCARENQDDPQQSCKHCIALGIPCTYDYQPKKRGPPNLYVQRRNFSPSYVLVSSSINHSTSSSYLRRLQEAAAAAAAAQQQDNGPSSANGTTPEVVSSNSTNPSQPSPTQAPTVPSQTNTSPYLEATLSPISAIPSAPIPPSRYPIAADTYHPHYPGMHTMPHINRRQSESSSTGSPMVASRPSTAATIESQAVRSPDSFNTYPLYNWSTTYKQQQTLPVPPPNALPPLSYYYRPHRLEDVAPRETIMLIINLFFDFVYPLTPCVHKPSFMNDLHNRREERDPLFFALVMSTCASTLVQVPRSYLPMERPAVRKLAQICHEASRHISVASYDPPASVHVVIRYL